MRKDHPGAVARRPVLRHGAGDRSPEARRRMGRGDRFRCARHHRRGSGCAGDLPASARRYRRRSAPQRAVPAVGLDLALANGQRVGIAGGASQRCRVDPPVVAGVVRGRPGSTVAVRGIPRRRRAWWGRLPHMAGRLPRPAGTARSAVVGPARERPDHPQALRPAGVPPRPAVERQRGGPSLGTDLPHRERLPRLSGGRLPPEASPGVPRQRGQAAREAAQDLLARQRTAAQPARTGGRGRSALPARGGRELGGACDRPGTHCPAAGGPEVRRLAHAYRRWPRNRPDDQSRPGTLGRRGQVHDPPDPRRHGPPERECRLGRHRPTLLGDPPGRVVQQREGDSLRPGRHHRGGQGRRRGRLNRFRCLGKNGIPARMTVAGRTRRVPSRA